MYTSTHQLNEHQLHDLEQLSALCKAKDTSIPNLYTHILVKPRSLPGAILCYKKRQLIGFLSAFFFYEDAVEVALLVAPKARKRGFAKQLTRLILPLLQSYNFSRLIFSSPANRNTRWLQNRGFSFLHSEYHMKREDTRPLLEYQHSMTIRTPGEQDIPALNKLDELCFSKKQTDADQRFKSLMDDRNYHLFIAFQNDLPIGKAHMRLEKNGVTLSDIAILPEMQGKGLGTALIAHCINFALGEGKPVISLDVEINNQRALNLYTRLGFLTQNACDFWSIGINQLSDMLA